MTSSLLNSAECVAAMHQQQCPIVAWMVDGRWMKQNERTNYSAHLIVLYLYCYYCTAVAS